MARVSFITLGIGIACGHGYFGSVEPTSGEAVEALKEMGIEVHLLTGDGKRTAETVAAMLDIRHYKADVLPSDKEEYIRSLQAPEGKWLWWGMVSTTRKPWPVRM